MRRKLILRCAVAMLVLGVVAAVVLFRSEPVMSADAIRIEYRGTNASGASIFWITNTTAQRVLVDPQQIEVQREQSWTNFGSRFASYPPGNPFPFFTALTPRSSKRLEALIMTPVDANWRLRVLGEEEVIGLERTLRALKDYIRDRSIGRTLKTALSTNTTYYGHHSYFYVTVPMGVPAASNSDARQHPARP